MSLPAIRDDIYSGMTLEELLLDFMKYGRPNVSCQSELTWYCSVEVFVTGKGISFKAASDFGQKTPLNAAQQCHERMRDAMKNISEMVKK